MKDNEKQEKAKIVQEVADDKMVEGKDTSEEKMDKASMGKGAKDQKEDEVTMQLNFQKKHLASLWDIFNKDYSKRDVKDTAYKEIADVFGCNISSVKGTIMDLDPNTNVK